MKDYVEMIERIANDFELELESPEEFNISKLIKSKDEKLLEDIELFKELSWKIRNNKIKFLEVNE